MSSLDLVIWLSAATILVLVPVALVAVIRAERALDSATEQAADWLCRRPPEKQ